MRRLTIFAHYDPDDRIDPYVCHWIQCLADISDVVFVSTSSLSEDEQQKVAPLCRQLIVKENRGYDFVSWQTGLATQDLSQWQQLIICNDSCYGPLQDLQSVFETMTQQTCDFWGITENNDIAYHLQSYFLVFNQSVLQSQVFEDFWQKVTVLPYKHQIVASYEIGLTQQLLQAGFQSATLLPSRQLLPSTWQKLQGKWHRIWLKLKSPASLVQFYRQSSGQSRRAFWSLDNFNVSLARWDTMIEQGAPILKVMALRDNPYGIEQAPLEALLQSSQCNYDPQLIVAHQDRVATK